MMLGVTLLGLAAAAPGPASRGAHAAPAWLALAGNRVSERRTGVVYDERCLPHGNPPGGRPFGRCRLGDVEVVRAARAPDRTWRVLEGSGVLERVDRARRAARRPRTSCGSCTRARTCARARGGAAAASRSAGTRRGRSGLRGSALLAAGGLLAAVDAVLAATRDNAFALVRPPGHHAERDAAMGFCLFNNTAVAARGPSAAGVERVAIVDWDVHHGNGTEDDLLRRPDRADDLAAPGRPLPAATPAARGSGTARARAQRQRPAARRAAATTATRSRSTRVVAPVVRAFAPDLLLVGAGQDAAASDPLGRMAVTDAGLPRADRPRRWRSPASCATAGSSPCSRAATRCSTCRSPISRSSRGSPGCEPSFPEDPIGSTSRGLRERSARRSGRRARERLLNGLPGRRPAARPAAA